MPSFISYILYLMLFNSVQASYLEYSNYVNSLQIEVIQQRKALFLSLLRFPVPRVNASLSMLIVFFHGKWCCQRGTQKCVGCLSEGDLLLFRTIHNNV